jgi:hypothetical protein
LADALDQVIADAVKARTQSLGKEAATRTPAAGASFPWDILNFVVRMHDACRRVVGDFWRVSTDAASATVDLQQQFARLQASNSEESLASLPSGLELWYGAARAAALELHPTVEIPRVPIADLHTLADACTAAHVEHSGGLLPRSLRACVRLSEALVDNVLTVIFREHIEEVLSATDWSGSSSAVSDPMFQLGEVRMCDAQWRPSHTYLCPQQLLLLPHQIQGTLAPAGSGHNTDAPPGIPARTGTQWMACVTDLVCAVLVDKAGASKSPLGESFQSDLRYFTNVLRAIDLAPSPALRGLITAVGDA